MSKFEITYLCLVGFKRQQSLLIDSATKFSNLLASRFSGEAFLFYGSSQILSEPPNSDFMANSNLPKYQYLSKTSVGDDVPLSTHDLPVRKFFFAANAFKGYVGKVWLGVKKGLSD